jgi:hypothetical protein
MRAQAKAFASLYPEKGTEWELLRMPVKGVASMPNPRFFAPIHETLFISSSSRNDGSGDPAFCHVFKRTGHSIWRSRI